MKNSNFKIYFVKTTFNAYSITSIEAEDHIISYFENNIIKHCGSDVMDILYNDEIKALNLENIDEGIYVIEGEIIIVHLYNNDDFEFVNLKLYEDK